MIIVTVQSTSSLSVNAAVFIESLCENDLHTGRLIHENLSAFFDTIPIRHEFHTVDNREELFDLLSKIQHPVVAHDLRPIVQIDARTLNPSRCHRNTSAESISLNP